MDILFLLFFFAMFFLIGICGTIFWVWALIDCATKEPSDDNTKIVWILIIVFLHLPGALIYTFVRRPQRMMELGR